MSVASVAPAFDPGRYPGPRASGPVLVHAGRCVPVTVTGEVTAPVALHPAAVGHPPRSVVAAPPPTVLRAPEAVRWSVAYGSNASPPRLVAKGLDRDGALLLPATVRGWAPAFEHRRTSYGAVPLTLVRAPEAMTATWVLGLPSTATALLDRSEGRVTDGAAPVRATSRPAQPADGHTAPPGTYRLARIGEVEVAARYRLTDALAYLPGHGTRIQLRPDGHPRTWPDSDQVAADAHLQAGGPARSVAPAGEAVDGPWPATPLVPVW